MAILQFDTREAALSNAIQIAREHKDLRVVYQEPEGDWSVWPYVMFKHSTTTEYSESTRYVLPCGEVTRLS